MGVRERLAEIRRERGMTQLQVGLLVGYQAQTISAWERGHSSPSLVQLEAWCQALGAALVVRRLESAIVRAPPVAAAPHATGYRQGAPNLIPDDILDEEEDLLEP